MKKFGVMALLLAVPSLASDFAGHTLGESVDEWITAAKLDAADICGKHARSDKRLDWKTVCTVLTSARAGQSVNITYKDDKERSIQWFFVDGKVASATMYQGLLLSSAPEQIGFLSEVYGKPSERRTLTNRNAVGGEWDTEEAHWDLPDGAVVDCVETVSFGAFGPRRMLLIAAESKSAAEFAARARQQKANPYKP